MKLKYNGEFPLNSVQRTFLPNSNEIYEIEDTDGKYLLNTFPAIFELIGKVETKVETKAVDTEEASIKKTTKK